MEQSTTIDIDAPPERVWEVLSDVEAWSEWTPTVTSVRRLDEGPFRTGSRAKIQQPRIPENEYVVTELEPGRSFTWVATSPGCSRPAGTTRRRYPAAAPGCGSPSSRAAGWIGDGRFYRGLTERYLANEANGPQGAVRAGAMSSGRVGSG